MSTTPTTRESAAAHRLAEALIEFVVSVDEGIAERRMMRLRAELSTTFDPRQAHSGVRYGTARGSPAPATELTPALMGAKQAGEFLHIGLSLLRELTAPHGPLPCVHLGRRVCYARDDLEAFIKAQTVRA